jgi:hypothetical protein
LSSGQSGEGTVDVVVYAQVDETTPGNNVATVMAVARGGHKDDADGPTRRR